MSNPLAIDRCQGLVGRTCIYRERLFIVAVEVLAVEEVGNLTKVRLRPLNLPGFVPMAKPQFEVSSAMLGGSVTSLSAPYVSWRLYDVPEIIDAVIAYAATLPEGVDNRGDLFDFLAKADRDYRDAHPSD